MTSTTVDPAHLQRFWITILATEQAYWFHDGNPKRPYAELSGGKISNFYADCTKIVSKPAHAGKAALDLLERVKSLNLELPHTFSGAAYGAVTFASDLTRVLGGKQAWYTVKGEKKGEMILDRFNFSDEVQIVAQAEDVITEGTATRGSRKAIEKKRDETGTEGRILPYVVCIVNRSGLTHVDDQEIVALITENRAKIWSPGENPFTPDGQELVPPVRPKQNWQTLTQPY